MGNSNTKEYCGSTSSGSRSRSGSESTAALVGQSPARTRGRAGSDGRPSDGKGSRNDGLASPNSPRELARLRKKAEREAAYACPVDFQETVDGGHLFPHGVYAGAQDFKGSAVREIIIARRLAPFYRPLETYKPDWSDEELLAAVLDCYAHLPGGASHAEASATSVKAALAVCTAASAEHNAPRQPTGLSTPPPSSGEKPTVDLSENMQTLDLSPAQNDESESSSSSEPDAAAERVDASGQSAGCDGEPSWESQIVLLYRSIHECPICFLLYPRVNKTSCCNQPICTECFVQIKRRPPHPAGSDDQTDESAEPHGDLTMDPAACPYCAAPGLSVRFEAPAFAWGLPSPGTFAARDKVSVDDVRPDWHLTLASARRRAARRSAASQALVRRALLHHSSTSADSASESGRRRAATVAEPRSTARPRRRSTLGDLVGTSRLTPAQARELEGRMIESAIQQSLREQ